MEDRHPPETPPSRPAADDDQQTGSARSPAAHHRPETTSRRKPPARGRKAPAGPAQATPCAMARLEGQRPWPNPTAHSPLFPALAAPLPFSFFYTRCLTHSLLLLRSLTHFPPFFTALVDLPVDVDLPFSFSCARCPPCPPPFCTCCPPTLLVFLRSLPSSLPPISTLAAPLPPAFCAQKGGGRVEGGRKEVGGTREERARGGSRKGRGRRRWRGEGEGKREEGAGGGVKGEGAWKEEGRGRRE